MCRKDTYLLSGSHGHANPSPISQAKSQGMIKGHGLPKDCWRWVAYSNPSKGRRKVYAVQVSLVSLHIKHEHFTPWEWIRAPRRSWIQARSVSLQLSMSYTNLHGQEINYLIPFGWFSFASLTVSVHINPVNRGWKDIAGFTGETKPRGSVSSHKTSAWGLWPTRVLKMA